MAIHITPDGLGQTGMMIIGAIGISLWIDAYQFVFSPDTPSFLSSFSIAVHLDERLRGLAQFLLGLCFILFAAGLWTVQVGAIAILLSLFLSAGDYWSYKSSRGAPARQHVELGEFATDKERQCPLTRQQKDWCNEDHDGDGTVNRYDSDWNTGDRSARTNCKRGYYVTTQDCK